MHVLWDPSSSSIVPTNAESVTSVGNTLAEGSQKSEFMIFASSAHQDLLARYQRENLDSWLNLEQVLPASFHDGPSQISVKDGQGVITVTGQDGAALWDADQKVLVRENPNDQTTLNVLSGDDPSVRCIGGQVSMSRRPLGTGLWLINHSHTGPSSEQSSDVYNGPSAYHFPPSPWLR